MKKINKITNTALIFILITVFLGQDTSYSSDASCLRIPISKYTDGRISQVLNKNNTNPVEKAKWEDMEFIGSEGESNASFTQEVKYKGDTYFAKWPVKKYYNDPFIIPEVRILRYLKSKGVEDIPSVERLLEMEDGTKVILFKKFDKGETLDEKIGKLSQSEAIDIILKVSRIVKALLDNGVYHWDIKPSNIWITDTGEVILFDFGIAFMQEENEFIRRQLYSAGSVFYSSPNRLVAYRDSIRGNSSSHSDEIYSLGITLVEILGYELYGNNSDKMSDALRKRADYKNFIKKIKGKLPELLKDDNFKELRCVLRKVLDGQYNVIGEFIEALEEAKRQAFPSRSEQKPEVKIELNSIKKQTDI